MASFSTIANIVRLNHITKELAKGNTEPLLDSLLFSWEDVYMVKGLTDMEDMDAYEAERQAQMENACDYYLAGKDVTVKFTSLDPHVSEDGDHQDF